MAGVAVLTLEEMWFLRCCVGVAEAVDRDSPRRANYLSFASPKESNQRKGDPTGGVPSLRYGQPVVLTFRGVRANSPAAQTRAALIREKLRYSALPEGTIGSGSGRPEKRAGPVVASGVES